MMCRFHLHREYMVEKYKENAFGRQRNEVVETPKEPEPQKEEAKEPPIDFDDDIPF